MLDQPSEVEETEGFKALEPVRCTSGTSSSNLSKEDVAFAVSIIAINNFNCQK